MISRIEKKILGYIEDHIDVLFFAIMTLLTLVVRYCLFGIISKDFIESLEPWFNHIKDLGWNGAMTTQVGNYNVPYQIIVNILAHIPGLEIVTLYKLVSVAFDYLLAFSCVLFVKRVLGKSDRKVLAAVFLGTLFLPTVIFNSSAWAQCDSIYVSFIILALVFLYENKFARAFILLGLSFSFKLQAIFIIPFFLYWYFSKKNFSLLYFVLVPLTDIVLCLPAILCGRSLMSTFEVYLWQSQYYDSMALSALNFWQFMGGEDDAFIPLRNFAVVFTAALLGAGLYLFMKTKGKDLKDPAVFLQTALWTMFTCFMFLPAMHERYSYGVEILFLLLVVLGMKRYSVFFIVSQMDGLVRYGGYLFGNGYDKRIWAVINILLYMAVTYDFVISPYLKQYRSKLD